MGPLGEIFWDLEIGENQQYFNFLKKSMKVGKDLWKLPPKLLRNYEHVTTLAKIPSDIWVTSLRQFPVLDWHGVIMCNIPLAGHVSMASNPGHWFQWIYGLQIRCVLFEAKGRNLKTNGFSQCFPLGNALETTHSWNKGLPKAFSLGSCPWSKAVLK